MKDPKSVFEPGGLVLAVDDNQMNLDLVEGVLSDAGFEVRTASDGSEALAAVAEVPPDCIVLDIMMPEIDGFEVCSRLKRQRATRFVPIIMLTALTAVRDKVRSLELGADDFLTKPVMSAELVARVRSLVKIKQLRDRLDSSESIVVAMVKALESKMPLSAGHAERVAMRAVRLAQQLELPASEIEVIGRSAVIHDIGKIGLPDRVLTGTFLTGADLACYRRHPIIGEQILAPLVSFSRVRSLVRHHHEQLNGSGYPDRLSGRSFDPATEIVVLANQYDCLQERMGDQFMVHGELQAAASRSEVRQAAVDELLRLEEEQATVATGNPLSWQDLLPVPTEHRTGTVVLGDSDPANRSSTQDVLTAGGHRVVVCQTGPEVIKVVEKVKPDLILVNVDLDEQDGVAVCQYLKSHPTLSLIPVIIMTSDQEMSIRRASASAQADDFLRQPFNRLELGARVRSLLRLHLYFKDLEEYQSVILSMASALEAKDPYTRGHSERVGIMAAQLAQEIGLSDEEIATVKMAGQLHDIGKIGVPDDLLNKAGSLTPDELTVVQSHASEGEEICRPLRSGQQALPIIRNHHEQYDGSGYPDRLAGEEIPITARILSLADAFDALTSNRSYRESLTPAKALLLLESETKAGRWDPQVFATLAAVVRRTLGG
jgi:putative two-component system response regulator